jgi:tRNA threonylcarbamoyl adenosine modification protein YjeE
MKTHHCQTEEDTIRFAQSIAADLSGIIALSGTLGAGKSTFARAVIQYLTKTNQDIPSPTFTLVQEYQTDNKSIYHLDLYRLENPEEIFELGWENMVNETDLVLIEWPDRIENFLPPHKTDITFHISNNNGRDIIIEETT